MTCSHCHTLNFHGFKFCRECGRPLDANVTQSAAERQVEEHLETAFRHMDNGDLDAARASCRAALGVSAQSASAHSLLSLICEREDDLPAAIRELEQVLELCPASIADRERLAYLRGETPPVRGGWSPFRQGAAAALVTLIVVGIGSWAALERPWERQQAAGPGRQGTSSRTVTPTPPRTSPAPLVMPPAPLGMSPAPGPGGVPGAPAVALPSAPNFPAARTAPLNPTPADSALNPRVGPRFPPSRSTLPTVLNPRRDQVQPGLPAAGVAAVTPLTGAGGGMGLSPDAAPRGYPGLPSAATGPGSGTGPAATPAGGTNNSPGVATNSAGRELSEPESGFIRIAPAGVAGGGSGASANGSPPVAPAPAPFPRGSGDGPPPSISIQFGSGAPAVSGLSDARRLESLAYAAQQQGDTVTARRQYTAALRLYDTVARRGGGDADLARLGIDGCRRALASLGASR